MTPPKSEFERELEDFAKFNRDNSVDSGMSEETAMYYGVLHGARWAHDRKCTEVELLERENETLKNAIEQSSFGESARYIAKLKYELDRETDLRKIAENQLQHMLDTANLRLETIDRLEAENSKLRAALKASCICGEFGYISEKCPACKALGGEE